MKHLIVILQTHCEKNLQKTTPLKGHYIINLPLRTFILIGRVGEVKHSVLLHGCSRDHRVHQLVVEVHSVDGQGHSAVQAASHNAAAAVVVVLVPHVDDNAAILHFKRLLGVQR